MQILPAIDLLGGQAVRLHQGRYDRVTVYDPDPVALAARMRGRCARLHVVDLEGARAGRAVQGALVRAVAEAFGGGSGAQGAPRGARPGAPDVMLGVQVGGGIRTAEAAQTYIDLGVERIVLGTAAVRDRDLVLGLAKRYPGRIVVALDAKDGRIAVEGWQEDSGVTAIDVARGLAGAAIAAILYTDVARDGTQAGPNVAATAALAAGAGFPVLASGGVGSLSHLRELARVPGVEGAIVGRALYEGAFTIEQAIEAARGL
ncbi:MAG: 1-(5-phosphoribosyl)-5-[(5-phosphoribosylamino)methylideneamino] imidazole-4-carboxamide isomerase [Polyangiaceae bacterium]|nr:1-(5-phosphoribosyl)-5-[(5-phosphoribosylamino)methylideneamino] imidazole-4-carboxamide isomerase [Polyangiaceae bacterium]